mgnify:CR=1 FL=1
MPDRSFPLVYECANCGRQTTLTQEDTGELYVNPRGINAVEITLQRRGWVRDDIKGLLFCPHCARADTHG